MKNLRKKLFVGMLAFLLSACDYLGDYYYDVSNEMDYALDISYATPDDTLSISVLPGETLTIYQHESGIIGAREKPDDFWTRDEGPINWLYISVDDSLGNVNNDSLINVNFDDRIYWTYTATARKARYILVLNQEFFDQLPSYNRRK